MAVSLTPADNPVSPGKGESTGGGRRTRFKGWLNPLVTSETADVRLPPGPKGPRVESRANIYSNLKAGKTPHQADGGGQVEAV